MSRPIRGKKTRTDAKLETRRAQIMKLRVAGATISQIAETVGIGRTTAKRDLAKMCDQLRDEQYADAERLRIMTATAIETKLAVWWSRADDDPQALDRVIKLLEQRCKLFGLYAPEASYAVVEHQGQAPALTVNFVSPDAPQEVIDVEPARANGGA